MAKPVWKQKTVPENASLLANPPEKEPQTTVEDPEGLDRQPSWRVGRVVLDGDFCWGKNEKEAMLAVHDKLSAFESMTWGEIGKAKKQHHYLSWTSLSAEARKAFDEHCREDERESLFSFRLGGTERIIGLRIAGVMYVLFWDPEHAFCPSEKKHT